MAAGKFSCDACGKTYSWKNELAGRRVKCKCGTTMTVPATDPAADELPDGFDDLGALADGAPAGGGDYAAMAGPARGGASCPTCGGQVDPSAVICVGCGTNLKTGKKLKTQKASAAAAGGAAEIIPGYRSYGAVATDEPMSEQKKKVIMWSSVGGLVLVIAVILAVVIPKARKSRAELEARLNAKPAKLERALTAMDNAGGFVAAAKDGSLLAATADLTPRKTARDQLPEYAYIQQRHEQMLQNPSTVVAKRWMQHPKCTLVGRNHEETLAVINELYALKPTSVMILDSWSGDDGTATGVGMLATLPTDKEQRKQIFAWYKSLKKTIEPDDLPAQREMGQKYLSIEFTNR